jgi:tetratricopeptide (TPR) repeat protein
MLRAHLVVVALAIGTSAVQAKVVKDGDLRVLRIRACADDEMREREGWEAEVREDLEFASNIFEQTFGIRFSVGEIVEWESEDRGEGLGDLVEIPLDGVDVVVGFSAQNPRPAKLSKYVPLPWGLTPSLGRASMVRAMAEDEGYDLHLAVVHEIAHLFGAFHVRQQDSVMRETVEGPRTFQFDLGNGKMIRLMRDYDFERGVEGIPQDVADRMTEIWRSGGADVDTSPLGEALFNRGIELYNQDRLDEAIGLWRRATQADDHLASAYGNLGIALADQGHYDAALEALRKADELGWPEAKQATCMVRWERRDGGDGREQ